MSETVRLIANGLGAASMLALAVWLMVLGPRLRTHRALAFWLTARASITFINQARALIDDVAVLGLLDQLRVDASIAATLGVFYFVAVSRRPSKWVFPAFATVGVVALVVHLIDPCVVECDSAYGPLGFLSSGVVLSTAAAAMMLAWRAGRWPADGPVAAGFGLLALVHATIVVGLVSAVGAGAFDGAAGPLGWTEIALPLLAAPVALFAIALLAARAETKQRIALVVLAVLAAASGFALGATVAAPAWTPWVFALLGVWRFVLPVAIVYGIVRHNTLGVRMGRRVANASGLAAGLLTAAFFVAGESLEQLVDVPSVWVGVGAAAAIGLLLRPVQLATHRMVDRFLVLD